MFHDKLLNTAQIPKSLQKHVYLLRRTICALEAPSEGIKCTDHVPCSVKTLVMKK